MRTRDIQTIAKSLNFFEKAYIGEFHNITTWYELKAGDIVIVKDETLKDRISYESHVLVSFDFDKSEATCMNLPTLESDIKYKKDIVVYKLDILDDIYSRCTNVYCFRPT